MKTFAALCICFLVFSACENEKEKAIFLNADYVTEEEQQWFDELEEKAQQGSQEARFQLVFHRDWMKGHYEKALPVLTDLAGKNSMEATEIVALAYRQGLGVEKNYEEAARWLERAAELGSESAQSDLEHYAEHKRQ